MLPVGATPIEPASAAARSRAQSLLQLLNVIADHRCRQAEVTGRRGEAAVLDDSDEGGDAGQAVHAAADYQAMIDRLFLR
jgi:hypothetical protein